MNKNSGNESVKRNAVRKRRFRKTFFHRVFNTVVLLALTVTAGFLLSKTRGSDCSILKWGAAAVYYSMVLLLAGWIFSMFSFLLRKAVVGVICFAILFVWGSASYFIWHVDDDDMSSVSSAQSLVQSDTSVPEFFQQQLEAPNRAISAFFPSRGGFEHIDRRHRFHYFFFHMVVIAFVAAIMFSHFGRGLVNRFKKHYVIRESKLNVFWGMNDVGLMLASDIIETRDDQEVAFLLPAEVRFDEEKLKDAVWKLDSIGAMWVLADLEKPSCSNVRGHRHFFLDESGHRNVSRANQLVNVMRRSGIRKPDDIFIYVRIEAEEDERIFFKWAEDVKEYVTPIFIRESDMIAKRFIEANPMLNCPHIKLDPDKVDVGGSFRVLLLGLGATGQSVLREMVANGQFKGISSFSVDVVEDNPAVVEAYKAQHEEAMLKYGINFIGGVSVEGPGFETFLANNLRSYNRIVVCLSGDVMNIRVASRIGHFVTDEGIGVEPGVLFVRVSDPSRRSYFNPASGMTLFGDLREVYSLAALNMDPVDEMAKILHGEWEKDKSEQNLKRSWNHASFNDQRSSRASALGERNLARVLGFEVVPKTDARASVTADEFNAVLSGRVDEKTTRETILAEDEHLRWNAYHRMLGYSCWDMKNPPLDSVPQKKANQLAMFGKHACLVDFSALPDVDYAIACAIRPENKDKLRPADFVGPVQVDVNCDGKPISSLQAYDYMFVRKILDNATAAGMKLVKV